jgi:hypothetical protein
MAAKSCRARWQHIWVANFFGLAGRWPGRRPSSSPRGASQDTFGQTGPAEASQDTFGQTGPAEASQDTFGQTGPAEASQDTFGQTGPSCGVRIYHNSYMFSLQILYGELKFRQQFVLFFFYMIGINGINDFI